MSDVFLSYASKDAEFARELSAELGKRKLSVSPDDTNLSASGETQQGLVKAIEQVEVVVILLSEHSTSSTWVGRELEQALQAAPVVLAVLLDERAKQNWLWPLLANRPALPVEDPARLARIVDSVVRLARGSLSPSRMDAASEPLDTLIARIVDGDASEDWGEEQDELREPTLQPLEARRQKD